MGDQTAIERDFFTDHELLRDPYGWLDQMRARGPVGRMDSRRDVVMVTGFAEAAAVLVDGATFSAVISAAGPTAPLPFTPAGADITAQIAENHHRFVGSESLLSYDGARHSASRMVLNRLFTPSRLKANEEYMHRLADRMATEAIARGTSETIGEIATPYVTLVIADLLGVPEEDREALFASVLTGPPPGSLDNADAGASLAPLARAMGGFFAGYITERRASPRGDVLTDLATATHPDGSLLSIEELIILAVFVFAAGQDTSAKLLGNAIRYLAENRDMQDHLRACPADIGDFIEEMLRLEGSSKVTHRLVAKDTELGGVALPAGTKLVASLAGANRDPARWDDPNAFVLHRPRIREHLAFGRGAHTCIGAPLARAEVRVMLERLLARTANFALSEAHHGPPGARRLDYEPSYIIRGLEKLYVEMQGA
ncbi:MAG: cytochrome P450 [Sphingomonadales bacterium]|nr:cytochrome P450 [Sphingomonadales bacterium]